MLNNGISQAARIAFERGSALVGQEQHARALLELQNAETLFRQIDARGHPFTTPFANGVSGLANTLFLSGLSHQRLGNYHQAVLLYETSFINSKFEKSRSFSAFAASVNENLLICYEFLLSEKPQERIANLLNSDPLIDTSYEFPFSLSSDAAVLARLFELSPVRYADYRDFYAKAKQKDGDIRKREKKSGEAGMRRLSFLIWSILIVIWAIYGIVVINTLVNKN